MNESEHILNVTLDTFQPQVIEQSQRVPVLVDYWADWCGPCQMQMPVLQKLVEEYAGKFVLAKVNTDENPSWATQYGVRGIPTMLFIKGGGVAMHFPAHLFPSQAGLIGGAGTGTLQVFFHQGKGGEHAEPFEGQ